MAAASKKGSSEGLRRRFVRPPPAGEQGLRLYDRTSGRSTPIGDIHGGAAADGEPSGFASGGGRSPTTANEPPSARRARQQAEEDEDRRRNRRCKARHWSEHYPLRMRRWIEHGLHDVGTRIFCDVVLRLPLRHASKNDVLCLVEEFGSVEYVASLADASRSAAGSGPALDLGTAGEHCHVVRFDEGLDAVKCFLELNGSCIDPSRHNEALEDATAALRHLDLTQNDAGLTNDAAGGSPSPASESGLDVSEALEALRVANGAAGRGPDDLIFVTVDFFRIALAPLASCGGVPARSSLSVASPAQRGAKSSSASGRRVLTTTGETPAQWISRRLTSYARELEYWHPIIVSHRVVWADFCAAASLMAFTLVTPTANAIDSARPRHHQNGPTTTTTTTEQDLKTPTPSHVESTHVTVAAEGLARLGYDVDDLMRLVDVSAAALDVMRGGTARQQQQRGVLRRSAHAMAASLEEYPLLAAVILLLLVSVVAAATVFVFQQSAPGRVMHRF